AGPDDVEDGESREVEQARPLAHREVLGIDQRRPPPRLPLGRSASDAVAELFEQRGVRLVPLRPLPAGGLEEECSELDLADVERRQAYVAVGRPLLARVDDAVGLVETLGRPR